MNSIPEINLIENLPNGDYRNRISVTPAYIIGSVAHILFAFLFYYLNVRELVIFNIVSPLIYLFCAYINGRGDYSLASVIGIMEVVVHSILSVLYIGWQSGFHYFILLLIFPVFFVLRIAPKHKFFIALIIIIIYMGAFFYTNFNEPKYLIKPLHLLYINAGMMFIYIVIITLFCYWYIHLVELEEKIMKENEKKLITLNTSKDRFFSVLSHDLKGPLNISAGFSELLAVQYDRFDDKERKRYISLINNSQNEISRLLDNLLIWSQSGTLYPKIKKLNLKIIVGEIINLLKDTSGAKNIIILSEVADNYEILADENMIKTILRNLLSNAIKFTYPGGEIFVKTRNDNEYIEIAIIDNGKGIDKENIQYLFDLENRIKTTGTNDEKGTGLGLIICDEFIKKMGGKILAESSPGKGSTFTVFLKNHDKH